MDDGDPPGTVEHRQALPPDLPPMDGAANPPESIEMTANPMQRVKLPDIKSNEDACTSNSHAEVLTERPPLRRCRTLNEFVDKHIFMRECSAFIKSQRTKKCGCNRDEEWHMKCNIPKGVDEKWSAKKHTIQKPTNAFGKIKLHGYGRLRAGQKPKYIRVDALLQEYEVIWNLLINHWNVPVPDIILSINGGAKKMAPMTQRLKVALKKGLMNVVTSARTWFITPGFNLGVAKLVGEAVREYSLATTNDSSFITIGFATWGAVYNRERLVNSSDNKTAMFREETAKGDSLHIADYYNCTDNPGKGQAVLDPHHSHFILCDDGSERSFNKEIDFRTNFENFIVQKMATSASSGSPVVQVVIEGGKKNIQTAYSALQRDTPVVVIQGSGRCADLICEILETTNSKTPEKDVKRKAEELLNCYREEWGFQGNEFKDYTKQLFEMCQVYRKLLHVFNVDGVSKELDRAILLAVFKSSKNISAQAQLSLAMNLNRCDLAAQEIFTEDKTDSWRHLDLYEPMFIALNKSQTEFVELFLDHGISIDTFLTTERLTNLYLNALTDKYITREGEELREIIENIKTPWWHYLVRCCRKYKFDNQEKDLLTVIGRVVQVFTGDSMPNPYSYPDEYIPRTLDVAEEVEVVRVTGCGPAAIHEDQEIYTHRDDETPEFSVRVIGQPQRKRQLIYPNYPPRSNSGQRLYTEQDLFLWAVLLNRIDLAKVFWRMGKDHIGSALVACAVFDQMQIRAEDDGEMELASSLEKNSEYFEMIATGILSVAYQEDKERTHLLLIRGLPYYGNETLLSLADQNECMDFMSHTAVQTKLNRIWMGGMSPYVPIWRICLNVFFSLFFIRLIFPTQDSDDLNPNKVEPVLDDKHMLRAEYIDTNAPNARELRETMAAQKAAAAMDPKSRETYLDQFRWRQQHAWKHVSYFQALYLYYTAPITKFILNTVSYVVFLLLLCYMVLVELHPFTPVSVTNGTCVGVTHFGYCIPSTELVIWIWTFTLIIEELRQIFMRDQRSLKYKLSDWISSGWNKFDCLLYVLFVSAIFMRFFLPNSYFIYTRSIYALILCMFFLRFMQTYYAHRVIGPKVVMITKMVNDILFFVAIFIIFLLAYGTAAQALLYPNSALNADIFKQIVYYPYWQVYGELTLDEVEGKNTGQTKNAVVIVIFAVYMLFTNVLLLNLLIAMFGYTFENVQSSSLKIWAYNRYDLILEYFDRPGVPPPFIIVAIIYRVLRYLVDQCKLKCCRIRPSKPKSDFKVILDLNENQMMSAFEQQCMERLMAAIDTEGTIDSAQAVTADRSDPQKVHRRIKNNVLIRKETGIENIADQVSVLKDIIERKTRADPVHGELTFEAKTPRQVADENYTELRDEIRGMRDRFHGLENMIETQAKNLENISKVLEGMSKSMKL